MSAPDPVRAVLNQAPPLAGANPYALDTALQEGVEREGGGWAHQRLSAFGERCGSAEVLEWGRLANENPPELHTHDRYGARRDEVEYHPAYHHLLGLGIEHGLHNLPWADPRPGAHVARGALMMLRHQVEEGVSCPLTMTYAAVPSLRLQPEVADEWVPRVLSTAYDPALRPDKPGATFGMAMTERQGGSDVRANITRAEPHDARGPGETYRLVGHKWFCSAPMSDAFLVLAQAEGGLSCFLVPRLRPDGTANALHFVRLKDKLGNKSNASSEVDFHDAHARMIGEEGRGVASIIEMVRHTRLDCALCSAATLRRAVAEALHHTSHRQAFGKPLVDQPLMTNVLADLAVESEAATALALRLARAFDQPEDEQEAAFARLATAVGKYWVTKRAMAGVAEAMECLGGNGYVEASGMPRLYRDVPVNAIWEGSGNVQCLDVLRTIAREPAALDATRAELSAARGADRRLDAHLDRLDTALADVARHPETAERTARRLVEALALALQGALLVQHAPAPVADAFCAGRLDEGGLAFGTLPTGVDLGGVVRRAWPAA